MLRLHSDVTRCPVSSQTKSAHQCGWAGWWLHSQPPLHHQDPRLWHRFHIKSLVRAARSDTGSRLQCSIVQSWAKQYRQRTGRHSTTVAFTVLWQTAGGLSKHPSYLVPVTINGLHCSAKDWTSVWLSLFSESGQFWSTQVQGDLFLGQVTETGWDPGGFTYTGKVWLTHQQYRGW